MAALVAEPALHCHPGASPAPARGGRTWMPISKQLLAFLEEQKVEAGVALPGREVRQGAELHGHDQPGRHASAAVARLPDRAASSRCAAAKELHVHLRGPLPRLPRRGECLTVHLTNVEQYQGYQVKTRAPGRRETLAGAVRARGRRGDRARAATSSRVHHSPYTMKFFEQIPFEEVQRDGGRGARTRWWPWASRPTSRPRFIFHVESAREARLVLYHGDGLALKTYMNLKSNRQETRLVLDLDDFSRLRAARHGGGVPAAPARRGVRGICRGFAAGNWGKPSRTFRFVGGDLGADRADRRRRNEGAGSGPDESRHGARRRGVQLHRDAPGQEGLPARRPPRRASPPPSAPAPAPRRWRCS